MNTLSTSFAKSAVKTAGTVSWLVAGIVAIVFTRLPAHHCIAAAAISMCLSLWVESRESPLSRSAMAAANLVALALLLEVFVDPMLETVKPTQFEWIKRVFQVIGSSTTVEVCAGLAILVVIADRTIQCRSRRTAVTI
ncbi:hypothetical protein DF134_19160 [Burkholderia stagnalis]|uniref:hypothetical protein n=1 Tax=Burkholderia stagnalis TaxID=1503054 RepID=UPI000F59D990|nr:hypothetical protein [Burkholderia stagnalis]RQQ88699.1 hypothetical protein DF134_19160 [Burkholderia stagnalis]